MERFDIARFAARLAGACVHTGYHAPKIVDCKDGNPANLVTRTDLQSEIIIRNCITEDFPQDSIEGEELPTYEGTSNFRWVIDPLDGTTNFVHCIPCFTVSIAVLEDEQPIIGAVFNPITNEIFSAHRGHGATLSNAPIHVSDTTQLEKAFATAGYWSRGPATLRDDGLRIFTRLAQRAQKVRSLNSIAFEICNIARGATDTASFDTSFLDLAAGMVILEEAGGRITDHHGHRPERNTDVHRFIASNNHLHEATLAIVNEAIAS